MSDPYYSSVSLLLHFDGANGSTTFLDDSLSPKTVTANGNAQISTAQSKFGGSSASFLTAGSYLSTPTDSAFTFGTGDFTIEWWLYLSSGSAGTIFDNRTSSTSTHPVLLLTANNAISLYVAGNYPITSDPVTLTGNWVYIAISKVSNSTKLFINGIQSGSTYTDNNNYATSGTVLMGAGLGGANQLNGYIDEFRVTKGVGRYTSNFTPPTEPFSGKTKALVSDAGPLGSINALLYIQPKAIVLDSGPLGQPQILGQQSLAYASAPSMLGPEQVLAWHLFARADVPSMLGDANPLAWHLFARADVPSMLGEPSPLATHDFTEVIGDATTYYVMDLTTPSGLVRVPISSWQATLQSGLSNYVQCVVPAVSAYVSAINAATQFKISRLVDVPGLASPLTYEMATAPVQTTTFDQGPFRYTCTISGYSSGFAPNETPSAAYNRIMQGIRSISINQSGTRVRCSIDWLLRPSQRVFASSEEFVVSYINYYVGEGDAYMEVGERA